MEAVDYLLIALVATCLFLAYKLAFWYRSYSDLVEMVESYAYTFLVIISTDEKTKTTLYHAFQDKQFLLAGNYDPAEAGKLILERIEHENLYPIMPDKLVFISGDVDQEEIDIDEAL